MREADWLDALLVATTQADGSDLHLAPGEPPRIRRNGSLEASGEPTSGDQLAALLEVIAPPGAWAQFRAQHDADFAYDLAGVGRFRVNCFQRRNGPAAVFRRVPSAIPALDSLGLPPAVAALADVERGLVLVAGPTGSGKSTTLAAVVDRINRTKSKHIVTIEDPIEYVHVNHRSVISHRQVGTHCKTFAEALRAAMHQDADVILVGELRDAETMALALSAAEMGSLVLGTLHTSDVPRTVDRLVEAFPGDEHPHIRSTLADTLHAALAQRLVPTADGRGRVAAVELLLRTSAVPAILREGKQNQLRSVMQGARAAGMQTMDDALQALLDARRILPQDAYHRATDPERFAHLLEPGSHHH